MGGLFLKPFGMKKISYTLFIFFISICFSGFNGKEPPIQTIEFLVFEGSDWCSNCKRLEKTILLDSTFKTFLTTESIQITRIDFPQRKKLEISLKEKNEALAEKYGFDGSFPGLILARTDTFRFVRFSYQNQTPDQLKSEITDLLKKLR